MSHYAKLAYAWCECTFIYAPAMVRTSRLVARLLASADTKQLEKGL